MPAIKVSVANAIAPDNAIVSANAHVTVIAHADVTIIARATLRLLRAYLDGYRPENWPVRQQNTEQYGGDACEDQID
jgi:hypothetical protein